MMVRLMHRIVTGRLFVKAALLSVLAGPAGALECTAPATWAERTICGSDELVRLDRAIAGTQAGLASAADPRFRKGLAADTAAWLNRRDACRKEEFPQACMEQRHYGRVDALTLLTNLILGPRRFGDPLVGCWQHSETEDQTQACLDARLADSLASLAVAAGGVREALAARDRAPDAAGDALALFDVAETAFSAHEDAACRSEAAALGEGRGRELGGTACRITLVRKHAVEILRFMPELAVPWTDGIGAAREEIGACLAETGPGSVVGLARWDDGTRIRILGISGARHDCTIDGKTGQVHAAVAEADVATGEGLARYVPGPDPVPQPACGLVDPVRDGSGAVIGHLVVTGC